MFYSYFDRRQVAIKKLDKNAKTPLTEVNIRPVRTYTPARIRI